MSGGVDSSVVAHLLKEEGHEVIGVRFTLWTDPLAPALAQILPSKCCTTQNIMRASNVAKKLDIPLHVIDLEQEFKESVVDPYLEAHKQGLTPNPCIGCNRTIKFGKLLKLAEELGCERLATGHYARTDVEANSVGGKKHLLLEAVDKKKDQSYFLYGLTQEQLEKSLFPLGGMMKSDVYDLAKHFNVPLPTAYRESQDLCFFPEKTPEAFLKRHLTAALRKGEIVRRDGKVLGTHQGLPFYTIGQRRGLGIGGLKVPLEVVEKDTRNNRLFVSPKGSELTKSVDLIDMRFVSWMPPFEESVSIECRVRSLSPRKTGNLILANNRAQYVFESPLPPLAPGQSLVLYRGEEVVGGGVISIKSI